MIDTIIEMWIENTVENAPGLAFMGTALVWMGRQLIRCVDHTTKLLDRMVEHVLDTPPEQKE